MYPPSGSLETNPLPQSDRRLKRVQSKTALEVERLVSKSYILRPKPPPRPSLALPHIPTSSQSPSSSGASSVSEEKASGEVERNSLPPSYSTHADDQVLHSNSPLPRSHSDHKPRPTSLNATFFPPQVYDLSSITPTITRNLSSSEKDVRRKRVNKLRKMLGEGFHPELLNPSEKGGRNDFAFGKPATFLEFPTRTTKSTASSSHSEGRQKYSRVTHLQEKGTPRQTLNGYRTFFLRL
jgi:hypothetical protein